MAKDRQLSPQEALNYLNDNSRSWGKLPEYSGDSTYGKTTPEYGRRYFWRYPSTNPIDSSAWTFASGATTITQGTGSLWPVKGQFAQGTNIPSNTVVTSKLSATQFTIDKATTGENNTDGAFYDRDPSEAGTDTVHIDVSTSKWILFRPNTHWQVSFSTAPKDIALIRSVTAGDGTFTLTDGNQEGDLLLIHGVYKLKVPQLGETIYFNHRPYFRSYSTSYYCYFMSEGQDSV
tara:strand:- start:849 stop:1547 length:699 start_codon:yes stop_codon:yes gene_type:complete